MFKPEDFFNLQDISFADIFKGLEFSWEALLKIKGYIESCKLKNEGNVSKKAEISGKVIIEKGAVIDSYSVICGPAFIGKNTHIRPFSFIRENTIIGENCIIRGEIKDAIILNNTHLAHFNYVGDSILGSSVNMGAGSKLANFRLDQKNIKIKINNKLIDTGFLKFGAILGDGVQIGCNAIINPGTLVGKNSVVYPLISPGSGFYPLNSKIK